MLAKHFVYLGIDQTAPDHSTLSRFRAQLTWQASLEIFEQLLIVIVQIAVQSGIQSGCIQVIDSVHSEVNVNTAKDSKRKENGEDPHDPDAKWGVKGKLKVKNVDGQEVEQVKSFFGYKGLVDQDLAQSHLIKINAADRGYDDGNNHFYLEYYHL